MTSSQRWGSFHTFMSAPAERPLQEWKPQRQPCCDDASATVYLHQVITRLSLLMLHTRDTPAHTDYTQTSLHGCCACQKAVLQVPSK